MKELTYATVCSGIECMSEAVRPLGGWKPVFFAEIEPYPSAVLKAKYPQVPNLGDMSRITVGKDGEITNGNTTIKLPEGGLDVLAGGCPCQDFSIAGLRKGGADKSGTRSSLCFDFVRLVREIQPRYVLFENVPGMFTSHEGRDFAHFILALRDCGYALAWRVLDAQFTRVDGFERAVPQRRRRVWLVGVRSVGHSGVDVEAAAQILFERKGALGDLPPRRITLKEAADLARKGDRLHAGMVETASETDDGLIAIDGDKLKPRLDQRKGGNGFGINEENVGYTLTVVDRHGVAVKVTPKDECFENRQSDARTKPTDVSPCIGATRNASADNNNPLVVHEQGEKTLGVGRDVYNSGKNAKFGFALHKDVQPTLTAKEDGGGAVCVEREIESRAFKLDSMAANSMKSPNPKSGIHEVGVAGCLDTTVPQPSKNQGGTVLVHERIADGISFDAKTGFPVSKGIAQTQVNGTCPGHRTGIVETSIAFEPGIATREGSEHRFVESVSPTIRADMGDNQTAVAMAYDGYNQSGHDEVSQTLRGVGNSEGDDCTVKVAIKQETEAATLLIRQGKPGGGKGPLVADNRSQCLGTGNTQTLFVKDPKDDADVDAEIKSMRYIVRRLTPRECERLMGLPDGYTIPVMEVTDELVAEFVEIHNRYAAIMAAYAGKKPPKSKTAKQVRKWLEKITSPETCPDAPRYKVCGNGWAVNCARWVCKRIQDVDEKGENKCR